MTVRTLMIQGTSSDAGKSTVVAGLGRLLYRRGINVAPFKPQNMALNSAVTVDGGEIGRAQALQAQACGLQPIIDMNPVLLKPSSDTQAQVILHGKAVGSLGAVQYHDYKTQAMAAVLSSHQRLLARHQLILVEGAGSPAEINLRDRDIANMGFAEAVDCPVLLVADIDRGGVFAQCVGTLDLLSASEQQRTLGFIINKFRGDLSLLTPGLDWLEQRTAKKVWGTLPFLQALNLDAEDALPREALPPASSKFKVVIPALPRISNHTDFEPLRLHPQLEVRYLGPGEAWPAADLIILPGSKNVRADLDWLRAQGWQPAINRHLRYGGKLIGICGGLQMLGQSIEDPLGIEGPAGSSPGLGLLDLSTRLQADKSLQRVQGQLLLNGQAQVQGYEIHCGQSFGPALLRPALQLPHRTDGAISMDNQILATYVHGVFDSPRALQALLDWAGLKQAQPLDYQQLREQSLERLADAIEQHLDIDLLLARLGLSPDTAGARA